MGIEISLLLSPFYKQRPSLTSLLFFGFFFFFFFFCLLSCVFRAAYTACGVELELRLLAYTAATAMQDLSHVCDIHHSSWQRQILNLLSKARD